MKKTIVKILSLVLISCSLFSVAALADENTVAYEIYISNPITVSADSSQWSFRSPYWLLATPDFEQGYCNAWANVNGTWYYIDKDGHLIENHIIKDTQTGKDYYAKEDGSLLINGYYTNYYDNQTKYYAGSDGALTPVNN